MAIETLQKFNRIINLTFYNDSDIPIYRIECPTKGRKPSIEINGSFYPGDTLGPFNITIKNLYLDLAGKQYSKIKVEAGYVGNTATFEGSILTMYQDEPGPESKLIIQCQNGKLQNWLDKTVLVSYKQGSTLKEVIDDLAKRLGTYGSKVGAFTSLLTLKERFYFGGPARGAISRLQQLYQDKNLAIFIRNNVLCAIMLGKDDSIVAHTLDYVSAPPQVNAGDDYYMTITAPWEPKLQIGDMLIVPSRVYVRNLAINKGIEKSKRIQVSTLSFHFGTTGGTNSMQVQGIVMQGK
jgi:hypothetical protein